jgi:hypothetical protein
MAMGNKGKRSWKPMNDLELIRSARAFIAERGIGGRKELAKADAGLYQALWRRRLLDSVGLEEKQRDWASMGDEELVALAKTFIAEKEIDGRKELAKADAGLYQVLRRRKLLDSVF